MMEEKKDKRKSNTLHNDRSAQSDDDSSLIRGRDWGRISKALQGLRKLDSYTPEQWKEMALLRRQRELQRKEERLASKKKN